MSDSPRQEANSTPFALTFSHSSSLEEKKESLQDDWPWLTCSAMAEFYDQERSREADSQLTRGRPVYCMLKTLTVNGGLPIL